MEDPFAPGELALVVDPRARIHEPFAHVMEAMRLVLILKGGPSSATPSADQRCCLPVYADRQYPTTIINGNIPFLMPVSNMRRPGRMFVAWSETTNHRHDGVDNTYDLVQHHAWMEYVGPGTAQGPATLRFKHIGWRHGRVIDLPVWSDHDGYPTHMFAVEEAVPKHGPVGDLPVIRGTVSITPAVSHPGRHYPAPLRTATPDEEVA